MALARKPLYFTWDNYFTSRGLRIPTRVTVERARALGFRGLMTWTEYFQRRGYHLPPVLISSSKKPHLHTPRPQLRSVRAVSTAPVPVATAPVVAKTIQLVPESPWLEKKAFSSGDAPIVLGKWTVLYKNSLINSIASDPYTRLVHCDIVHGSDGRAYLRPYGPTFVNGKLIFKPTRLKAGDSVRIGRSTYKVRSGRSRQITEPVHVSELANATFSLEQERKKLRTLMSEHALLHPHLWTVLESADALPEGRAMRYVEMLREAQSNIRFLKNLAKGETQDFLPDDSYNISLKSVLRNTVGNAVKQPAYEIISFNTSSDSPEKIQTTLEQSARLADFIKRHKRVYLKPDGSSAAYGVTRVSLEGSALSVYSTEGYLVKSLARIVPGAVLENSRRVMLPVGTQELPDLVRTILNRAYCDVIMYSRGVDRLIAEEAIAIPKLGQRTWEIRSFRQVINGRPRITSQYAKVGAGSEIANIQEGGSRADVRWVVKQIYAQRYPTATSAQLNSLTMEFMREVDKATSRVIKKLCEHLKKEVGKHTSNYPLGDIDITHIAVDITGKFDERGRLVPVLMEVNKVGSLHEGVEEHEHVLRKLNALIAKERNWLVQCARKLAA